MHVRVVVIAVPAAATPGWARAVLSPLCFINPTSRAVLRWNCAKVIMELHRDAKDGVLPRKLYLQVDGGAEN